MRAPRDGFLDAAGLRLHYLEWGTPGAPAVLLLHGSSAHAHWWDLLAADLASGFHLVALDLRGHGDSAHAEPPDYALEHYAADAAAVARALGLPSLRVVGHSLGALVAIVFAAASPVAVEALVLVDIRLRVSAGGRRFLDRLRHWPHPVYASREEAVRRFRLLPSATAAAAETLERVAAHGVCPLPGGRFTLKFDRRTLSDAAPRDVSREARALRCPILYVRGAKSTLAPPKAVDEVKAIASHAEVAEVADAYHHVMLDNPEGFTAAVRPFLHRNTRVRIADS
jgi:pimeloyl-ACP methyl ester carboxylesterase